MRKSAKPPKKTPPAKVSPAQPDSLDAGFDQLRSLLATYAPPFRLKDLGVRNKKSVALVVPKPISIPGAYGGKPVDFQFAAAILQKGYIGFYMMCVYTNEPLRNKLSPALLKTLKGKSCFHLKRIDDSLLKDVAAALNASKAYDKSQHWLL